jgi:hypothetical protein
LGGITRRAHIRTLTLTYHRRLKLILDLTPPPLTQLRHTQALTHVGEYAQAIRALVPNTPKTNVEHTERN